MSTRADATEEGFWGDVDGDVARQRYRTLVNTIDDGIYQLDAEGNFVAVNEVIVELTGYARDELVGEHVSLVLDDDDIETIQDEIHTQLKAGGTDIATFELGIQTAGGDTVPCELRVNLLVADGEFEGTIGVARELTERQQRRKTLDSARESHRSVRNVLDEANIGVFVLDENFDVAWIDETVEEYFGLDRSEVVGRDKRALIEETVKDRVADPDRFADTVLPTYDDNADSERFECRIVGDNELDLEERWLEHHSKPIESGQYDGGRIELYYDITDRKESEGALQESRAEFQSLVDAVEEYAIFRLDADGHVVSWNSGAKRIKGYDCDEILGEHFSTFYTDEDREAGVPERNLERALEDGSVEDEGWRVREDGRQFWANVTITPISDDDGTHSGYLKVTRDMTDWREREQELESELQRLFGRISDAFYAVDEEFRFTHVNERAEELLQHSEDDLLGERLWDVFPDLTDLDEVWDAFHTALEQQEATSYELYYDTLDFWVEANLYPSETGISVYFRDVTERKEREQYLEDAKAQLEAATEAGAVGTWEWKIDEDRFVTGASFARTFGVDPDAAREGVSLERILSSIHEADRDRVERKIQEAVESGGEYEEEYRVWNADGELRWVVGRGHVECDDDGNPVAFPGALADITERKQAELELEKQQRQLETLFQVLPVGAVVADADGSLIRANETAREIWGGDVFDAESVEEYEKYSAVWAETGEPVEPEDWTMYQVLQGEEVTEPNIYEIETFDDEQRIIMEHGMPVRDAGGNVSRAVVTLTDITERREYERQLETLMDNVPGMVYRCRNDRSWPMEFVSDACREITGYDPESLETGDVSYGDDVVLEDDREEVWEEVQQSLAERDTFSVAYRIETADGERRWVRSHGRGIFDDDGTPVTLEGIISDITERKRLEIELRESNERLEQFAYAASHDLQEPLRMVTSYLQLLERRYGDELDEDGEEFIGFAVDGAERMRAMIDALLEYSRVETRGESFEPIDLDEVLTDAVEDLQLQIEESDAEITSEQLPDVMGDASQVRQVFQNLLSNAITYSGDDLPCVHVDAKSQGGQWVISVHDDGIGIDPEDQERIFSVFDRLHSHEEHEGTGIGLALCERIVERHDGEIWVESNPGDGSTFSFTLPAAE
ncbi:PAS domain S-box protein [Natronobacterium texcoconense]|uniref:histidine kinase n=1 Tax=Natronobacterium texcoconense TaxID=1095778 RepID=A0A1H1AP28_NATTX|nr:PAS domain S-box protein [Natronobacterium texcoconense]SDQ41518.1 PAS domain S-box-containing protein [Natronobacterium texcoconense]